jgi:GTP-binding protein
LGIEKTQKIFLKKKEKIILTSAMNGEGCKELKIALDEMVPNKQNDRKVGNISLTNFEK